MSRRGTDAAPEHLGRRARELLTNQAFTDALETARRQVYQLAVSCDVKDDLGRARWLMAARLIDGIERHLSYLLDAAPGEEEPDASAFYAERARSMLDFLRV